MLHKKYFEQNTYSEEGLFDVFKKKFTEEEENILKKAGDEVRELFQKNYKRFFPIGKKLSSMITALIKKIDHIEKQQVAENEDYDVNPAELVEDDIYDLMKEWKTLNPIADDILKPFYKIENRFKRIKLKKLSKFFSIDSDNNPDYQKAIKIIKILNSGYTKESETLFGNAAYRIFDYVWDPSDWFADDDDQPINKLVEVMHLY